VPRQVQRGKQGDQRDCQREIADIAMAAREEQQQDGTCQRQKNNDGEDVAVDEIHRTPLHTMKAITSTAPMTAQPGEERILPDCICRISSETSRAPAAPPSTAPSISPRSMPFQNTVEDSAISGCMNTAP